MEKLKEPINKVADALGKQYTLMRIDGDWCLYRDLGNGYDIEVNLRGTRKISIQATIYVWQVRDQLKVIEIVQGIKDIEDLKDILMGVVNKTNRLSENRDKVYKPILQLI